MVWQDLVIMTANVVFLIALVPQAVHGFKKKRGVIGLWTAGPTSIGVFAIAYSMFTLKLYLSALISALIGLLWLSFFIQRLMYKPFN